MLVDVTHCLCLTQGCGGVIHADTGAIKSPNYPLNFPANIECSWTIIAHEGNHLEMSFNSDFQIPDSGGQCQSSYVKVPQRTPYQNTFLFTFVLLYFPLLCIENTVATNVKELSSHLLTKLFVVVFVWKSSYWSKM